MKYPVGKVVGIRIYRNDVQVIRQGNAPPHVDTLRGEITCFSKKSRLRLAFVASNTPIRFLTMVTLTYPERFPNDGRKVKRDLKAFLEFLRRDIGKPNYLWFLEFQKRGAPHIHILLDWPLPRARANKKAFRDRVAMTWYRLAATKDPKHLAAGTRVEAIRKPDGGARYCVKYCLKMRQKAVPEGYRNVGRFWGCRTNVLPEPESIHRCTEDDIRAVLDGWEYAPPEDKVLYKTLFNQAETFREWLGSI